MTLIDSKKIRNRSNRNSLTSDLFGSVKGSYDDAAKARRPRSGEENGVSNDDKFGI